MLKKHISIATILLLLELFAIITFINYPLNAVLVPASQVLAGIAVLAILYYTIQQGRLKTSFLNKKDIMNSLIPGTLLAAVLSYIAMKMLYSPL